MTKEGNLQPEAWSTIQTTALTAVVAGFVALCFGYFRRLSNKVSNTELQTILKTRDDAMSQRITTLESRISRWEQTSNDFARQKTIDDLNAKIDKMESRIEAKLDSFQNQVIELLKQVR